MKLLKDILYKARLEQVVGSTNAAIELMNSDPVLVTSRLTGDNLFEV